MYFTADDIVTPHYLVLVNKKLDHTDLGVFDMPYPYRYDILSISIFFKIPLSISIFSRMSLSISISIFSGLAISISIFFKFANISNIDINI